jgi:hypothetical protein
MRIAFAAGALVLAFPVLAAAQVAILQIQVTEGDQAVHAAGSRSSSPLTVQVSDETGQPVAGAAVSFRLPEDGPGGHFANGLRTDLVITDSNGRATIRNLQVNRIPGPFQIRIVASRDQARAGTLTRQFITGPARGSEPAPGVKSRSSRKWIVVAVLAAGIGGGLGIGTAGRSGASPRPTEAPVSLGTPTITLGKP